ncbi:MAG: hypothetical protein ACYTF0_04705, partial [Planctomycetota bacterium]
MRILLLTLCCLLALPAAEPTPKQIAQFTQGRAALRDQRATLRQQANDDRERRAAEASEHITTLLDTAIEYRLPGQAALFDSMIRTLERLDPEAAAALDVRVTAELGPEPAELDRKAASKWNSVRKRTMSKWVKRTQDLLNKSIKGGVTDLSYEFLRELLGFWPDNERLRKQLGQHDVNGSWLGPYATAMAKKGMHWDQRLGWVISGEEARYEAGEIFDLTDNTWRPLDAANAAHAKLANPWLIRTEHLELRGHVDLPVLVEAANKLEAFYAQIFAAYSSFFTTTAVDYKLILGMSDHDPLPITIYRDKEQYHRALPQAPSWSAGRFSPSSGSHLYGAISDVMYHEFTHQILFTFT